MTFPKFTCRYCRKEIATDKEAGIQNRNHCPYCLYSVHLDQKISGDRKSVCGGKMKPLGLTFKKTKPSKYQGTNQGELMLIHQCCNCKKISINRIAGDDNPKKILEIFQTSLELSPEIKKELKESDIEMAIENDLEKIKQQLFGKL
ncbi:MAG: RNHCP domain-containing protein [Patescibacteria group bacterium]|nr:RNHCP domain-containing protein [Patescibacteria group bacterium]